MLKHRFLFCIFVLLASQSVNGQYAWDWASGSISSHLSMGKGMCEGNDGSIYQTGSFENNISFASDYYTRVTNCNYGFFLAKCDSSGTPLWLRSTGPNGEDEGFSVCTDAEGNVYAGGEFDSSRIVFDNDTFWNSSNQNLRRDGFVVKYDAAGSFQWCKVFGGTWQDEIKSVICDGAGNVYVSGYYTSTTFQAGNLTLSNPGSEMRLFLAKLDPGGNLIWLRDSHGAATPDYSNYLAIDEHSSIYLASAFSNDNMLFGATSIPLNSSTDWAGMVVVFDTAGNVLRYYVKELTAGVVTVRGINCDHSGKLALIGQFSSGSFCFGADTLVNSNSYLAVYDSSGNELWARGVQTNDLINSFGITSDLSGNFYVSRGINFPVNGYCIIENDTVFYPSNSSNVDPLIITRYGPTGSLYSNNVLISGGAYSAPIAVSPNGNHIYNGGGSNLTPAEFPNLYSSSSGAQMYFACLSQDITSVGTIGYSSGSKFISIYPVPAIDLIHVTINGKQTGAGNYCIFDEFGRIVKSGTVNDNDSSINIQNISPGIFSIRIETADDCINGTFVRSE